MEIMWGLKNCMHHLVPAELTKDDRPLMSEGMKRVLDKYHFDYKPEIVSSSPHFPYMSNVKCFMLLPVMYCYSLCAY